MLDDLTIVELGQGVAPAYCGKLFADLGADVIKVEPPQGDVLRRRGPFLRDEPGLERSGLFAYLNTSKRGVTLDVTSARGRELLPDLLKDVDVVIENGRPPALSEFGLRYDDLRAANRRLVLTSVTPFGQDGPWSGVPANEFIAQHTSGVAYNNGQKALDLEAEPPFALPDELAEYLGGLAAASATMCAIWGRDATGEGAHVDIALQEALAMHLHLDLAWITFAGTPTSRATGAQPAIAFVGQQPVADGYVDFVIRTDDQWRAFVDVLDNPEWGENELFTSARSRAQYWDGLEPLVREDLQRWRKHDLFRASQEHGVPAAPVNTIADAAATEHFADRGEFVEHEHPVLGRTRLPGPPVRFGVDAWALRRPAPRLGEHNDEVFRDRLGLSEGDLARLRDEGIV